MFDDVCEKKGVWAGLEGFSRPWFSSSAHVLSKILDKTLHLQVFPKAERTWNPSDSDESTAGTKESNKNRTDLSLTDLCWAWTLFTQLHWADLNLKELKWTDLRRAGLKPREKGSNGGSKTGRIWSDVNWSGVAVAQKCLSVSNWRPVGIESLLLFKICNITTSRKIASTKEQNNNNNNKRVCLKTTVIIAGNKM